MNKAAALFATTTVILAATTVYLAHALMDLRAREREPPDARAGAAMAIAAPMTSVQEPGDDSPAATNGDEVSADPAPVVKLPPRVKNRTYSAAQLAYLKLQLQDEYPDLATALGFQPAEAEALLELLARQRLAEQEDARARKPGDADDWQKAQESRRRSDLAEQAALLGDVRVTEWNQYRETLGSRAEVRELRMQLADSDYPLRRDQYDSLVTGLAQEQIRHWRDREQLHRSTKGAATPTAAQVIDHFDKRLALIEDSLARRETIAASVLDSEQLRRYRQMLDHQRQLARAEYESFVTLNAEAAHAAN